MHLLNIVTMKLETFTGPEKTPPYSILSHTWGTSVTVDGIVYEEPEVLYEEWDLELQAQLQTAVAASDGLETWELTRRGRKLLAYCKTSLSLGFTYGWIDTLCIDKRVS